MSKPDILLIGPYPEWDLVELEAQYNVRKLYEAPDRDAFISQHAAGIRAIATRGELGASAELIGKLPKLEVISVYGVGYDAVNLDAARARGIRVTNTPGVLTNDVADLGVAMMLVQSRGMIGAEAWVRDGSWGTKGLYPLKRRVWGRKAGVLGLGRIGFEVAKRLKGFEMDIAYSDVSEKPLCRWHGLHRRSGGTCPAFGLPVRDAGGLDCHAPYRFEECDRSARARKAC
jgi:lactate dehydrogenase-like 2-hydroxyacid dehydrogenase